MQQGIYRYSSSPWKGRASGSDRHSIINFIKKYPIKYLIVEEINKEDNHFFKLDEEYRSNKFICKFAFPFIGITINKIILETENSEEINIRNLTGSGLGSFLERKIFYAICSKKIFGQIENRYINSFSEVKKVNENEYDRLDIYELIKNNNYDYLNYNRKILDDIQIIQLQIQIQIIIYNLKINLINHLILHF